MIYSSDHKSRIIIAFFVIGIILKSLYNINLKLINFTRIVSNTTKMRLSVLTMQLTGVVNAAQWIDIVILTRKAILFMMTLNKVQRE